MKIVSFANPISCQLNPAPWNILKFKHKEPKKGGRGRWTENCGKEIAELEKEKKNVEIP